MGSAREGNSTVVVDASPVIVLEQVGLLGLLHRLYDPILVPSVVAGEVRGTLDPLPDWLTVVAAPPLPSSVDSAQRLDQGEQAAIAVALAVQPRFLVVDDRDARRVAEGLRLPIVGTVGVLIQAKEARLVATVRPLLDRLVAAGLFVGDDVYQRALMLADETQ